MKILRTIKYSPSYINYIRKKYPNFSGLTYQEQREIFFSEYYGWGDSWDHYIGMTTEHRCTTLIIDLPGHTEKFAGPGNYESQVISSINTIQASVWLVFDRGPSTVGLEKIRAACPSLKTICKWVGIGWETIPLAKGYDLVLTCLKSNFRHYNKNGQPSYFFPSYCDRRITERITPTEGTDILFCGSINSFKGAHFNRAKILYQVARRYEVKYHIAELTLPSLFKLLARLVLAPLSRRSGPRSERNFSHLYYFAALWLWAKEPLFGTAYYNALASARVVLNIDIDSAGAESGNLRIHECLTIGARIITDYKSNIADLFDGKSLIPFRDATDILNAIDSIGTEITKHKLFNNDLLREEILNFLDHLEKTMKEALPSPDWAPADYTR